MLRHFSHGDGLAFVDRILPDLFFKFYFPLLEANGCILAENFPNLTLRIFQFFIPPLQKLLLSLPER